MRSALFSYTPCFGEFWLVTPWLEVITVLCAFVFPKFHFNFCSRLSKNKCLRFFLCLHRDCAFGMSYESRTVYEQDTWCCFLPLVWASCFTKAMQSSGNLFVQHQKRTWCKLGQTTSAGCILCGMKAATITSVCQFAYCLTGCYCALPYP